MGGAFSSGSSVETNSSINIKNLQELKKELGFCNNNLSSNNSMCDLPSLLNYNSSFNPIMFPVNGEISDDFLNNILLEVRNRMNENSMLDLWPSNAFPETVEGASLVSSNMISPDIEDDEMEVLVSLVKDRIHLIKQNNANEGNGSEGIDSEGNNDGEENVSEENNINEEEEIVDETVEIDNIYRGSCIYKLDNYTFPYRIKEVTLENLFVGNMNGRLELFSPSDLPQNSNLIEMYWTCIELADGSIHIMLDNVETVIEKELSTAREHFTLLDSAFKSSNENNTREMSFYTNKFKKWKKTVLNEGKHIAYCGGEQEGELLSLQNFFDRLEL
jgi:hypothetical protein